MALGKFRDVLVRTVIVAISYYRIGHVPVYINVRSQILGFSRIHVNGTERLSGSNSN